MELILYSVLNKENRYTIFGSSMNCRKRADYWESKNIKELCESIFLEYWTQRKIFLKLNPTVKVNLILSVASGNWSLYSYILSRGIVSLLLSSLIAYYSHSPIISYLLQVFTYSSHRSSSLQTSLPVILLRVAIKWDAHEMTTLAGNLARW